MHPYTMLLRHILTRISEDPENDIFGHLLFSTSNAHNVHNYRIHLYIKFILNETEGNFG